MSLDHAEQELEIASLALLGELGWQAANGLEEMFPHSLLGRDNQGEAALGFRLAVAVERLNPNVPERARQDAIEQLVRLRPPGSEVRNNRDVWNLLRDGAKVEVTPVTGGKQTVAVRFIDWEDPGANEWLAVRQFRVVGELYPTRADIVGFVNGVPLVFIELKAPHIDHKHAYDDNLTHYRQAIPQLFWFNGVTILSNGDETKVGSFSAPWEHFGDWKRIAHEAEAPSTSIERALRGVCEPARLLDLVENFTLFQEVPGGLIKILAMNHQIIGVNNVLALLGSIRANQGRLGVFWHTQGSGKSFSMIFLAQKALRKISGRYTFVVVTDREDLDDQIYKNFISTGAVTEPQGGNLGPQATSSRHLRELLRTDHRYVFTLIQKFRSETGQTYPVLTERDDVIVLADEAHRTQYDTLALNLRNALPNAAFLAFTGTPLIAGEERTREVFGEYVSVYNFRQSIEDKATVPLFYEKRVPEVQLINEDLNRDMERILEDAELDENQERRLAREFGREYHLITDADRLRAVANDLVDHYVARGHQGKALVISIDKATAVRMYDLVQEAWMRRLDRFATELAVATGERRAALEAMLLELNETDMAVVVSSSQNEITDLAAKGVDIVPHRKRMNAENLATKFKDPEDPLRIVFVCAMWLTGFDAPATSTIYLDKPMRNHTLMQTIARVNRVFQEKVSAEIVDYIGVFRDIQAALAIYGSASGGGVKPGDFPVESKDAQAAHLMRTLVEVTAFAAGLGVDLDVGIGVLGFDWAAWLGVAAEKILGSDDARREYLARADAAAGEWKALKPHPSATGAQPLMTVVVRLAQRVRMEMGSPDISGVLSEVEELLDASVDATPFIIDSAAQRVDLTRIDFEALAKLVASGKTATAAARLRASLERRIEAMVRVNPMRVDYATKLQGLIDRYNSGATNIEAFFEQLKELARSLSGEEQRHVREQLSEEELTVFDLLTKPDPTLTTSQEDRVKKVVRDLLEKLKGELLVLDWKKHQATRAAVRVGIESLLDAGLPDVYDRSLFARKSEAVFEHVFASYENAADSLYHRAGAL
ncbi:MAG: type I restriction endonuclease subunit R [Chloroflexi bacterium]|nr:type I restriction endonuclease subunit R [Chloroflexota bacterium]